MDGPLTAQIYDWCPKGRWLHLVDAENLCGTGASTAADMMRVRRRYFEVMRPGPHDRCVQSPCGSRHRRRLARCPSRARLRRRRRRPCTARRRSTGAGDGAAVRRNRDRLWRPHLRRPCDRSGPGGWHRRRDLRRRLSQPPARRTCSCGAPVVRRVGRRCIRSASAMEMRNSIRSTLLLCC